MLKRSITLIPARTELYQAKLGFYLLIASLGMFFAATLISYATIRIAWDNAGPSLDSALAFGESSAGEEGFADEWESFDRPSTTLPTEQSDSSLLAATNDQDFRDAMHRTMRLPLQPSPIRAERVRLPKTFFFSTAFLLAISVTLHLAVSKVAAEKQRAFRAYILVSMILAGFFLLIQNAGMANLISNHFRSGNGTTKFYGIAYTLAFIHALHVYGGFVLLGSVLFKAYRNRYDHERHWGVDICAGYWHFLDVVWLAMIGMFFWLG